MLPIVRFPKAVEEQATWFDPVFATARQRKHFREYVTGLIVGHEATVTAINSLFLDRNDQSALNKFVTQAPWNELTLNRRRIAMELARLYRRPVSVQAGRLLIDDTMAHHTRCGMEGLAYLWDRALGRYVSLPGHVLVWAHNVVTSYYVNRADQFPVDFRLWFQFRVKREARQLAEEAQSLAAQPTLTGYREHLLNLLSFRIRQEGYRTKTVLAAELVRGAIELALPFAVVLFDGWFLHNELIDTIEAGGKDWIGGFPKDRLVLVNNRWLQIQHYLKTLPAQAYRPTRIHDQLYWTFTKVLSVKSLHRRRLRIVVSFDNPQLQGEPRLLACNRKEWERTHILLTYSDRWPTETFNEDVKGHLGFEDYQLHKLRGIRRHWYLCLAAYSLLGDQGHPGRSRHGVHVPFESTGQRCRAVAKETLGHLVEWIAQHLKEGVPTATLVKTLLA